LTVSGNVINNNHIGSDKTNTVKLGNKNHGIFLQAKTFSTEITNNVIVNNEKHGIEANNSFQNIIHRNMIGTDGTQDFGNGGDGIHMKGYSNIIGGDFKSADYTRIPSNVISGNQGNGITILGSESNWTEIYGNFIGTDKTGSKAIPNEKKWYQC